MELRERIETDEKQRFAPWASCAAESAGRAWPELEHAYRTCYQRDRDRVLHSRAFRRLQYKTQVFVLHEGDHFRNRLTHTLEVAQIARTIARALACNEDLTEAIVLAHDLGHTPFGHSGERALHALLAEFGGFEHNRQSLRIVDWLEVRSSRYRGLNLTAETRAGVLKHGSDYPRYGHPVALPALPGPPSTEAQIANLADSIAYNAHDVDDGLRSGLLEWEPLLELELLRAARDRLDSRDRSAGREPVITKLIDLLVSDLVITSRGALEHAGAPSLTTGSGGERPVVRHSDEIRAGLAALSSFLRRNLYLHHRVVRMASKGQRMLRELWAAYAEDRRLLPPGVLEPAPGESTERAIADHLAGMTDRFALEEHRKLFDPHVPA